MNMTDSECKYSKEWNIIEIENHRNNNYGELLYSIDMVNNKGEYICGSDL